MHQQNFNEIKLTILYILLNCFNPYKILLIISFSLSIINSLKPLKPKLSNRNV